MLKNQQTGISTCLHLCQDQVDRFVRRAVAGEFGASPEQSWRLEGIPCRGLQPGNSWKIKPSEHARVEVSTPLTGGAHRLSSATCAHWRSWLTNSGAPNQCRTGSRLPCRDLR